jgi:hypothetical protein
METWMKRMELLLLLLPPQPLLVALAVLLFPPWQLPTSMRN